MPISPYLRSLRAKVGHDLLVLPSVTIIVWDEQRRILLIRHADTQLWVAPGGSIEPHETPADAAVREMWEETGLLVRLPRVLGVFGGPEFLVRYSSGDEVTYVMTVFEAEVVEGTGQPTDTETLEMAYVSREELERLALAPWAKVVLPHLFDGAESPLFQAPTWMPPER
jgi:8-oxo-dGTP pyrophosphatase MutT (NUDIX family)